MGPNGSSVVVVGHARRRRKFRRFPVTRHLLWSGLLRIIQQLTHYKRDDRLEFKINFSVLDLLSDKGRVVKDQVGAFVHGVQNRVPPDVLSNLTESTPVREAARLSRATAQRLRRGDSDRSEVEKGESEPSGGPGVGEPVSGSTSGEPL